MEPVTRAKIVCWQGGSLWLLQTPPAEPDSPPRNAFHAHHAIQFVFSLGGTFSLRTTDRVLAGDGLAVAPDTTHQFEAQGAYAILFVEPESRAGRAIAARVFGEHDLCGLPTALLEGLRHHLDLLDPASSDQALLVAGQALVDQLASGHSHKLVDPRIQTVVSWIAREVREQIRVAEAARLAGLSPSRFSHLFVEQTGLSFKSYLLWVRLNRALTPMLEGETLTTAAHQAGFADSAHFSRTFRRMFGVAPIRLQLL